MALVRKNLIVDAERLQALAEQRGLSESAAVREAVEQALAVAEVMAAIRGLHDAGAFTDFEELFPPVAVSPGQTRSPGARTRRGATA
jgi:Ribbon-helix-helix protein, copG family